MESKTPKLHAVPDAASAEQQAVQLPAAAVLDQVTEQRNRALNDIAMLRAQLSIVTNERNLLARRVAELDPEVLKK